MISRSGVSSHLKSLKVAVIQYSAIGNVHALATVDLPAAMTPVIRISLGTVSRPSSGAAVSAAPKEDLVVTPESLTQAKGCAEPLAGSADRTLSGRLTAGSRRAPSSLATTPVVRTGSATIAL
jgi:hypothetical protein